MGKNDFDKDFDFEKEYGFDPRVFGDAEEYDTDIDFSEFTDEDLGLTSEFAPDEEAVSADPEDDLDLGGLDLGAGEETDDIDLDELLGLSGKEEASGDFDLGFSSAEDTSEDFGLNFSDEELMDDMDFSEEPQFDDEPDFPEDLEPEETDMDNNMDYSEEPEVLGQAGFNDFPIDEDPTESVAPAADPTPRREPRRKERKERQAPKKPKITTPNFLTKFFDLYFAPLLNKSVLEEPVDPNNPRRRRKKSKVQIFKEVYLPPIIACVCLILVFSFVIGAISNAIDQKQADDANKKNQVQESLSAAALADQEYQRIMDEAAELAAGYDYQGAIDKLDSFSGDKNAYQDLVTKRAEYANIQTQLVEHKDPSLIPNLSFHVLVADLSRALADAELGGNYNRNFVSTAEFSKILQQLYDNGYVLVDFDDVIGASTDVSGNVQFESKPILLPAGKKPVMITETMVNYFNYMIDGNDDGAADAGGDGFASRLVLQGNEIKAEYVDASGATQVGDYDLVPILESFIKQHPDFSYRGARATLAVCGYEGIFGYRINSTYIATKGQAYYDEQVAGAKEIVQALRDRGYTLACYTYDNIDYAQKTAAQIQADLQSWTQNITPVIGDVDILVYARNSDITDYSGNAFNVMHTSGFRYFVSNGTAPWAEVNKTYVRQKRLMVTGNSMAWSAKQFTDLGLFDPNAVLDLATRVSVPN